MRHTSTETAIDHVALAILRRAGQVVLVQQQAERDPHPCWLLPGGLVEAGELVVEALIREVQEEAGVQVATIAHLACLSQINRPARGVQVLVFIFAVEEWHGALQSCDPDAEILQVELVPEGEAIRRLQTNRAWRGIQEPLLAYLRGEARAGTLWFYREDSDGQRLVTVLAP